MRKFHVRGFDCWIENVQLLLTQKIQNLLKKKEGMRFINTIWNKKNKIWILSFLYSIFIPFFYCFSFPPYDPIPIRNGLICCFIAQNFILFVKRFFKKKKSPNSFLLRPIILSSKIQQSTLNLMIFFCSILLIGD